MIGTNKCKNLPVASNRHITNYVELYLHILIREVLRSFMFLSGLRMSRRCSCCGNMGHNSRTCTTAPSPRGGFKLFGVQLQVSPPPPHPPSASSSSSSLLSSFDFDCMKRSFSMDCLSPKPSLAPAASPSPLPPSRPAGDDGLVKGYHSDGLLGKPPERKKGNSELDPHFSYHLFWKIGKKVFFLPSIQSSNFTPCFYSSKNVLRSYSIKL